jgi:hypothetical protein
LVRVRVGVRVWVRVRVGVRARVGVGVRVRVRVKVRVRVRVRAGARVSALDLGPVRHLDELELGLALSPTDTQGALVTEFRVRA